MAREQIPGWDPIVHIYREWLRTPPRKGAIVVEIGVALGRSLSFVADWCLANDRRDVEVYAVDSWCGHAPNGEQQTMSNVAGGHFSLYAKMMLEHDARAFEFIRPLRATSAHASRMFDRSSIDLVVIDADHSYEGCMRDITYWLPLVKQGGWIGGDDHHEVHHPGVIQACRETFGDGYEVISGANGWPDGRAWLKKL
jgi:hypothetical protein